MFFNLQTPLILVSAGITIFHFYFAATPVSARDTDMSVQLKVGIRCRPFAGNDNQTAKSKLGISMQQTAEGDNAAGQIVGINQGSGARDLTFPFNYAWWSAYNYKKFIAYDQDMMSACEAMPIIGQEKIYDDIGISMKKDLVGGNAVVIFAYGLSGSGKTYTVFGPDDPAAETAWFKHETPHKLWGVFPRLALALFSEREANWKFKLKYFQNVVNIVRDLMDPAGKEETYKKGMHKLPGTPFMDIDWCKEVELDDWNHLRRTFATANARKAIAPTQFNHQSTRGHCIMVLTLETPLEGSMTEKKAGRLYVCDLAGAEPAADVFYAKYRYDSDGEPILVGPHADQAKTKNLQDQGKKINLSLSEMAQFFMKMAQAIKKKKLKPGKGVPGCNTYFLSKFLKDTMLNARTYLTCAIRPEAQFHKYTRATLRFAKDASVVKLQPKVCTKGLTKRELQLMQKLKEMEDMVEQMKKLQAAGGGGGGGGGADPAVQAELEELRAKNAAAEAALKDHNAEQEAMDNASKQREEQEMLRKKEEMAARGMSLVYYDKSTTEPHFINIDDDPFRTKRTMWIFGEGDTTIGKARESGIRPFDFNVKPNHCVMRRAGDSLTIVGGDGPIFVNGTKVLAPAEGAAAALGVKMDSNSVESKVLAPYDRIVLGGSLFLFSFPGQNPPRPEPTADEITDEYRSAEQDLNADMQKFAAQLMEAQSRQAGPQVINSANHLNQQAAKSEARKKAMDAVNFEAREMFPKVNEANDLCHSLDRDALTFSVKLQQTALDALVPTVKVQVLNNETEQTIMIDTFEFLRGYSSLKDEYREISTALEAGRVYNSDPEDDPIHQFFNNTYHCGTVYYFPEYLMFGFQTDESENEHIQEIKAVDDPAVTIGRMEITWTPLTADDEVGACFAPATFSPALRCSLSLSLFSLLQYRAALTLFVYSASSLY